MENEPVKKKYIVRLSAEGEITGEVWLTEKEAELVGWVTNPGNWQNIDLGQWFGQFDIWPADSEDAD